MAQPFKNSAFEVLSDERRPLSAGAIVEKAARRKLLDPTTARASARTMSAVLSCDIRRLGAASRFVRRGDLFGLNPALRPGPAGADSARALLNGRAGEHSVAAELLFRGFDARPAGDGGADIVAEKGGRRFLFQVKTSAPVRNRCSFFIPAAAHEKFDRPGAYYAFVMRSDAGSDFLVMPYREVQRHVRSGRIEKLGRKYRAELVWGDRIALDGIDVTRYRRRWPRA